MLKTKDFHAGLLFIVLGLGVAGLGWHLPREVYGEIGPGGFPMLIAALLVVVGLGTMFSARKSTDKLCFSKDEWRALIFVLASVAVFALLIRPLGVLPCIIIQVVVASFANRQLNLRRIAATAVVLALMSWVIFAKLLQMPLALINI